MGSCKLLEQEQYNHHNEESSKQYVGIYFCLSMSAWVFFMFLDQYTKIQFCCFAMALIEVMTLDETHQLWMPSMQAF